MVYATYHDLAGKLVVITGGGTGIGADIAAEFCRRGAKVMITSRTMDFWRSRPVSQPRAARPVRRGNFNWR